MADNKTEKDRKKNINVFSLSLNSSKMAASYGIGAHGASGFDGKSFFSDFAKGLDDPRTYRKKGTYISK